MADVSTISQTIRDQLPRDVESRVVLDVNPDLHGFRVVVGFYRASDNQLFHTAIVFGHKDWKLHDADLARVCVLA